ncbi:hypothetical protein [Streptomyces sp. NBC_01803]|uniref:hypothetical protein n=1 Tax=Streptomyces sp. NBC_01803 TaxID=2975946 RepID=UPI002DDABA7C|nr:hypothetical protein [Streptomyces sp. NBC_01803]WSA45810.1 hypothetical protein OIE51_17335 [Streptomyces sp. NBC_01803]
MSYGQGGPAWVPGGSNTPDWDALAADAERRRGRRRLVLIGGSAFAAVAIGTLVALAIVNQSGDDDTDASDSPSATLPDPSDLPSGSDDSEPTFQETTLPPLPEPREFISDADKDLAPFEPDTFYAGDSMEIDGRTYTRAATEAATDCAGATSPDLGTALAEHGCTTLLRATYTGDGVAVTVGVAQFASEENALAAREEAGGAGKYLLALTGGDAPSFCQRGGCRTTSNQVGRYTYFTIAGNSDGTPDSGDGTPAQQAARDGNDHAFASIIQRGEAQASASASAIVEERRRSQGG